MNTCQFGYGVHGEDEEMLVGTKAGLENLIVLCEKAIEDGEASSPQYCDFLGIKMVDDTYWEEAQESDVKNTLAEMFFILFMMTFFASVGVGFVTIVKYIYGLVVH